MKNKKIVTIKAGGEDRVLNVRRDPIDIRDKFYEPPLMQLQPAIDNRQGAYILDQGKEGACTGFGLAAVINFLNSKKRNTDFKASPRMLYEMAKKHDEWPGEDYDGSSCRGAIKGWKNMGVCREEVWPYQAEDPGELTIERAIEARSCVLGTYYRLRPEINDYHVALNEVGSIYVSAAVHEGWWEPTAQKPFELAIIQPCADKIGGHAFAIVGYNEQGFIVQNSWGVNWGSDGFALWLYEDWLKSISDGWIFRLALPTPTIFGLSSRSSQSDDAEFSFNAPKRLEIQGHFVHFDDGKLKEQGSYWNTKEDVENTAKLIKDRVANGKYQHLLIYAHGGLNSPKASARRIVALKNGYKRNGIYPFHIMYDTGLAEELKDTIIRTAKGRKIEGVFSDIIGDIADHSDKVLEDLLRKPVTPIWEEMKRDAREPFIPKKDGTMGDGLFVIKTLADCLQGTGLKIHLVGHSTGAVLLGHLLTALDELKRPDLVSSCSLMAPACTIEFYEKHYAPRLEAISGGNGGAHLPALDIYNLNERLEKDDNVATIYRKSFLYLISNALERESAKPLLGMQCFSKNFL
ncbi:MAG: C1 family peptidase [Desulfobulbaceae bacterium]|nr:C1 family peptidase [Desulfobulbaceae bacterium]